MGVDDGDRPSGRGITEKPVPRWAMQLSSFLHSLNIGSCTAASPGMATVAETSEAGFVSLIIV